MSRCPITATTCERGCQQICRNAPLDKLAVDDVRVEPGDVLLRHGEYEVRVMAVAENWVMARRKGCAPFLIDLRTASKMPIAKGGVRPKGWKLANP